MLSYLKHCKSHVKVGHMQKTKRVSQPRRPPVSTEGVAPQKDTTTFSIRLTDEQRDLLVQAAELRGWTPTSLVRTATLEKAAHILNTSRPTKFNIRALASLIADQLFKPRAVYQETDHGAWIELDTAPPFTGNPPVRVEPSQLTRETLEELDRAARFGGGEFLNLTLEFCRALTVSERSDLPDPVDPGGGASREGGD